MDKLWERILDSLIDGTFTQGFITVALVGTACTLVLMDKAVPELIGYGLTSVLGFYFGSQAVHLALKNRRESE